MNNTTWKDSALQAYADKSQTEIAMEMCQSIKAGLGYLYKNKSRLNMSTFVIQYISELAQASIRALHRACEDGEVRTVAMNEKAKIKSLVEKL